jgi:transcriptional repressor NrdR
MRCPFCGNEESKVTDSRNGADSRTIRRRRECLKCMRRFTTFESIDLTIQVKKRDGKYQEFQIEKLIRGLDAACRHTRISHDQVRALASDIMQTIFERGIREIDSLEIGEILMDKLKVLDTVAYVRFACVYRRFKDRDELMHALEDENQI